MKVILLYFPFTDCGNPSPANGVSINPYTATTIGSAITFQCKDGLIPVEEVSASCGMDGEWHPDPSLHVCGNDSTGKLCRNVLYISRASVVGLCV